MAVRFDIDKYNKVRDSYLAYIKVGKIDAQLSPLYDTYKVYWQNDPEVKTAEQALRERKARESSKIGISIISTNGTNKNRKISAEQRITAKIDKIHIQWGKDAQSTRKDANGNFTIMRQRHTHNVNSSAQVTDEQNRKEEKPKVRFRAGIAALSGLNDVDYAVQKALYGVTGSRVEAMRSPKEESEYIYKKTTNYFNSVWRNEQKKIVFV